MAARPRAAWQPLMQKESQVSKSPSNTMVNSGFLGFVAKVGNKLPNPFVLFSVLAVLTLLLSWILSMMGTSVTYMAAPSGGGDLVETTVQVRNLLTAQYFKEFVKDFVKIYITFAPLGIVMVTMLGIGYVQDSGFFDAFMRKTLLKCPAFLVTFVIAVMGICANISGNAGIIISTTLAAAIFASLGRNPILGAVLGYACGHGGFTANLLITSDDALLSGITKAAADSANIVAPVSPLMNWYFMIPATLLIATVATIVTEFIMPRYVSTKADASSDALAEQALTPDQERGLKWALYAFLIFLAFCGTPTAVSCRSRRSPTASSSLSSCRSFLWALVTGWVRRPSRTSTKFPS